MAGWPRRYPRLIREIHLRGHEIGCHSLDHQLVNRMSPNQFYESTATAKDLIESIIQEPIYGYRAPCFSITPGCEWAFDALAKLGFSYDSSVHPVHHPTYGNPTAPRSAYPVAHGQLMEFPIATWRVAGRNLSVGGGAYLRLLPYQYIQPRPGSLGERYAVAGDALLAPLGNRSVPAVTFRSRFNPPFAKPGERP